MDKTLVISSVKKNCEFIHANDWIWYACPQDNVAAWNDNLAYIEQVRIDFQIIILNADTVHIFHLESRQLHCNEIVT